MIAFLTGRLRAKSPTETVVEVNGVGYALLIPVSTYERLGGVGEQVTLHTHLHVREDVLQLYGFATEDERSMFRLLLGVNGIGPRMAQGVLSGMSPPDLRKTILQGNVAALTSIPGVGRKTAERLVVELREKIGRAESAAEMPGDTGTPSHIWSEAMLALTSLGFSRPAAEQALRNALRQPGTGNTVEALIKRALQQIAGT
jgi:Holliday junction DNA helicase RuvA